MVFLPTYSPELNPIEMLWRKIKYEWLPLSAYQSVRSLCSHIHQVLSGYGETYRLILFRYLMGFQKALTKAVFTIVEILWRWCRELMEMMLGVHVHKE
ncbi:transposase [Azotobacter bryophylli]|uniref:Transposase n=1 Tax=Azotobacter bryophylli TaxID=1986537 RepID=A0ABV7AW82_9GAMM